MKPHISLHKSGIWVCDGHGVASAGYSPRNAYIGGGTG